MSKDFNSLTNYLKDLVDDVPTCIEEIVKETAFNVEREAKKNAPVDTGRLRGSITTKLDKLEAEVGTNVKYASFVEYGTSRQAAKPFMSTARISVENDLDKIVAKGVRDYLRS